jgi:cell wall-associated protease
LGPRKFVHMIDSRKSLFEQMKRGLLLLAIIGFGVSCGGSKSILEKNPEIIQAWSHLDPKKDKVPGMSVDKAYKKIIKNQAASPVIVAVIDSGIDLAHEDLATVLWTNSKELAEDLKDNDGNGYIDDIHGYNFLGESYHEQLEATRIVNLGLGDAALQEKARARYEKDLTKAVSSAEEMLMMSQIFQYTDQLIRANLGKEVYTAKDLEDFPTNAEVTPMHIALMQEILQEEGNMQVVFDQVEEAINYFKEQLAYNLKLDFDGRAMVGDNPYDILDAKYGNGNPMNRVKDESHGTHVAGIIAADRNNNKGVKGVANNVQIMAIRAVPNGDEYDKDIALAIRYAADNGAKVINMSFGKPFSPNAEWVYEAIKYAAEKDVLLVHAAGNDGMDLDDPENPNFPNDHKLLNDPEFTPNVITVGALAPSWGENMIASFSNYGRLNVDIFAPGARIYATMPENAYDFQSGTSMAAPAVAGLAALIRGFYPDLTAIQVKQIIMQSGLSPAFEVFVNGDNPQKVRLNQVSRSGKIANLYEALLLAKAVNSGKVVLQ